MPKARLTREIPPDSAHFWKKNTRRSKIKFLFDDDDDIWRRLRMLKLYSYGFPTLNSWKVFHVQLNLAASKPQGYLLSVYLSVWAIWLPSFRLPFLLSSLLSLHFYLSPLANGILLRFWWENVICEGGEIFNLLKSKKTTTGNIFDRCGGKW